MFRVLACMPWNVVSMYLTGFIACRTRVPPTPVHQPPSGLAGVCAVSPHIAIDVDLWRHASLHALGETRGWQTRDRFIWHCVYCVGQRELEAGRNQRATSVEWQRWGRDALLPQHSGSSSFAADARPVRQWKSVASGVPVPRSLAAQHLAPCQGVPRLGFGRQVRAPCPTWARSSSFSLGGTSRPEPC